MELQHESKVVASMIHLIEFKFVKGLINADELFKPEEIKGYKHSSRIELMSNVDLQLIKLDCFIQLTSDSGGGNSEEATGNFHFIFIFKVDNFEELSKKIDLSTVDINPELASTLTSISYSTSRGILLTRLQGTPFQKYILPIINPNSLLSQS